MTVGFPPVVAYPLGLDSDRTLYKVYNTTESKLSLDNEAWSDEISIIPVGEDKDEVWPDNGFATLEGEILYYDSVGKNDIGKVNKLKRIARNLGGSKTKFNKAGTWIRGFIMAEHHNQLVLAIRQIEKLIGISPCDESDTLVCTIEDIDETICIDDNQCPQVTFEFDIDEESSNNCEGTVTIFNVIVNGVFNSFQIDFGDGTFTTTEQSGTKVFAPNTDIDPIVTVSNEQCQIVQTPVERIFVDDPPPGEPSSPTTIPIPEVPTFNFTPIPIEAEDPVLELPPINFPCLEFGPVTLGPIPSVITISPPINIPSSIDIGPVNIPSFIDFGPVDVPSLVEFGPSPSFSPIDFGPAPTFTPISFGPAPAFTPISFGPAPAFTPISFGPAPTFAPIDFGPAPTFAPIEFGPAPTFAAIEFGPAPTFAPISIGPAPTFLPITFGPAPTFAPIEFGPAPSFSPIEFGPAPSFSPIDFGPAPTVSVDWGTPPTISCDCTIEVACPSSTPFRARANAVNSLSIGDDSYIDDLNAEDDFINLELDGIGIPSKIEIVAPKFPDIKITGINEFPKSIPIDASGINLPQKIELIGPATPIPNEIKLIAETHIPEIIRLQTDMPSIITLDTSNIPKSILLEVPADFPSKIMLDGSDIPRTIQVIGIPESIELKGYVPSEIELKLPENIEVPLVYKGGPIPFEFTSKKFTDDDDDMPCFALTPCPQK